MGVVDLLVIDDEPSTCRVLVRTMTHLGYSVASAGTGKEAFTLVLTGLRPKVVISDYIMPDMNGAEFVQKVRALGLLSGVPVYIMSGGIVEVEGAAGYIQKPFELDALEAIMVKHTQP